MRLLYSLSISLYAVAIKIAALTGNSKAKKWVSGRKNWASQLQNINPNNKKTIWIHAASLGEFEQAMPVIELLKKTEPNLFIVLSLFSPSGFEVKKNYATADKVIYLPIDLRKNASLFLDLVNPQKAIFIKYEFWFNYLSELKDRKIPSYLVSGIFRPSQHFFKSYGSWFRKKLGVFQHFFVQNEESQQLLSTIGYKNSTVTGDTRLDRVIEISKAPFSDYRFESFSAKKKTIIFGSSWSADNKLATQLSKTKLTYKIIIVPHEIHHEKIQSLKAAFNSKVKLFSETKPNEDLSTENILIIDQIGLLSKIYRYAYLSFIGGGFGSGIHNILEAAVYGSPVIFGPNYQKFQEAKDLVKMNGGFSISSFDEFNRLLETLKDEDTYLNSKMQALEYVSKNKGATKKVIQEILTSS
ncbi:MAG: 3-deoxy-D-manno-octulosonic acid transferase [Flavobacteriales bacterium]|nr:3-deoxy-D-manno-octulosonic acid transferase [Flavobacteriales bacterium]